MTRVCLINNKATKPQSSLSYVWQDIVHHAIPVSYMRHSSCTEKSSDDGSQSVGSEPVAQQNHAATVEESSRPTNPDIEDLEEKEALNGLRDDEKKIESQ